MTERYDAIVIGAGHNGLVCAALLAKAGKSVDQAAAQLRNCRQDGDLVQLLAPMDSLILAALDAPTSTQSAKLD